MSHKIDRGSRARKLFWPWRPRRPPVPSLRLRALRVRAVPFRWPNPETPAHARCQGRDASGVRTPVLLCPRRTGGAAGTTDERSISTDVTPSCCAARDVSSPRRHMCTSRSSCRAAWQKASCYIIHPQSRADDPISIRQRPFPATRQMEACGSRGRRRHPRAPIRSRRAAIRQTCGPRWTVAPAR
jgi:hypothetical protein